MKNAIAPMKPINAPMFKAIGKALGKPRLFPAVNIIETAQEYMLTVAAPGFRNEEFEILVDKDVITLSATKKEKCDRLQERREYDYTTWTRSFLLPDDADVLFAKAKYRNGELFVRIPKGFTMNINEPLNIDVY